jgi:MmyB-like transcription regulator ligand binding domain
VVAGFALLRRTRRGPLVDWTGKARDTVSDLRIELGRRPDDDRRTRLVDELRLANRPFARPWEDYPIAPCAYHDRRYRRPVVGELTLHDELLELADDEGQRLALFTAVPPTASASALEQLTTLVMSSLRAQAVPSFDDRPPLSRASPNS